MRRESGETRYESGGRATKLNQAPPAEPSGRDDRTEENDLSGED